MPEISVIIPVYNTERYLEEAVESILKQEPEGSMDIEVLLINDGSTDGSLAVCNKLADAYPQVRVFSLASNQGAAAARNLGLDNANGEFLAFQDSDDVSHPDRFRAQLDFLKANPEVFCVATNAQFMDGRNSGIRYPAGHHGLVTGLCFGPSFIMATAMCRRAFVEAHGIRNDLQARRAQDYLFWVECAKKGARFANLRRPLYRYRVSGRPLDAPRASIGRAMYAKARQGLLTHFGVELSAAALRWVGSEPEGLTIPAAREMVRGYFRDLKMPRAVTAFWLGWFIYSRLGDAFPEMSPRARKRFLWAVSPEVFLSFAVGHFMGYVRE